MVAEVLHDSPRMKVGWLAQTAEWMEENELRLVGSWSLWGGVPDVPLVDVGSDEDKRNMPRKAVVVESPATAGVLKVEYSDGGVVVPVIVSEAEVYELGDTAWSGTERVKA